MGEDIFFFGKKSFFEGSKKMGWGLFLFNFFVLQSKKEDDCSGSQNILFWEGSKKNPAYGRHQLSQLMRIIEAEEEA